MLIRNLYLVILLCLSILLLSACGTFEIGIESNTTPIVTTKAVETPPAPDPTEVPQEPTTEPSLSDEEALKIALGEKLGLSMEVEPFGISVISGEHAKGNVSNGYFLAAKRGGEWVIVYDGQGTPPCNDIDQYQFPAGMVPECLGEANQLVRRSGGSGGDIGDALAEHLGEPRDKLNFTIMQDTGTHIMGYVPGGYFLAVKVNGNWQIIFAGNGTPYCAMVDLHDFPAYIVPECVDADSNLVYRTDSADNLPDLQSLDCGPGSLGASPGTVESVACNIQDALRSRNISPLLGYLTDPFTIGYWLSEGVQYTPNEFLALLPALFNFNDPYYTPQLTFTTDRSQFPELDGRSVESGFGPNVDVAEVIYSQGWGVEGDQEALIYLTQDSAGDFKWYGMLTGDFDIPVPGP